MSLRQKRQKTPKREAGEGQKNFANNNLMRNCVTKEVHCDLCNYANRRFAAERCGGKDLAKKPRRINKFISLIRP